MKKKMLTIILPLTVVIALLCGFTYISQNSLYTDSLTYETSQINTLQLNTYDWNVHITSSADDQIHINISGKNASKTEVPVTAALKNGILSITQNQIIRDFISNFSFGTDNSIEIAIPLNSDLTIAAEAVSSDITMSGTMSEDISIVTSSGEVKLTGMSEPISLSVTTTSGDITLQLRDTPENLSVYAHATKQEVKSHLANMIEQTNTSTEYLAVTGNGNSQLQLASTSGYILIR